MKYLSTVTVCLSLCTNTSFAEEALENMRLFYTPAQRIQLDAIINGTTVVADGREKSARESAQPAEYSGFISSGGRQWHFIDGGLNNEKHGKNAKDAP